MERGHANGVTSAALKTLMFTVLVPGAVTILIPFLLVHSRPVAGAHAWFPLRFLGILTTAFGALLYAWCACRFVFVGKGAPAKRAVAKDLVKRGRCIERKACGLVEKARSTVRYERRVRSDEGALRKRMQKLAVRHKRYGGRALQCLIRRCERNGLAII